MSAKNKEKQSKNVEKPVLIADSSLVQGDEFRKYKYSVLSELSKEEIEELKNIRNEIIQKIRMVLNHVTPQALKRASLSSRGTTLKSLMNAFHIVQLHLKTEDQDTVSKAFNTEFFRYFSVITEDKKSSIPTENDDSNEKILEKIRNYVAVQKKVFLKQKHFD